MDKKDKTFLICAFASMVVSIVLWFSGHREYGQYVGIWVPSILGLLAIQKLAVIQNNIK